MSLITLGAHLGDNSVDRWAMSTPFLGTTGGCHVVFGRMSTAGHTLFVPQSHGAVDQAHRHDLGLCLPSPLSTAPTTTTTLSISQQERDALSPRIPTRCRSPRVTKPVHRLQKHGRSHLVQSSEPEDLS